MPENHSQGAYLRIRSEFNASNDRFERAVRFIYLNRLCFNGVFRVNNKGVFNVPYGRPAVMPRLPAHELEAAALKLQSALVLGGGFQVALDLAVDRDVVYCDPPYSDSNAGKSFVGYTQNGFGEAEHVALVSAARRAASRGATVLVSNHDTAQTRALYRGWEVHPLVVRRSISAEASSRAVAKELLAILRPGRGS